MRRPANWLEPRLYRLFRIPPKPELLKTDEQGFVLFNWDRDSLRRWHLSLPWYGAAANRLILAMHRAWNRDYGMRRWYTHHLGHPVNRRRAARALANARTLVYTSHYTHDPENEMEVEGYFELLGDLVVWLTIRSAGSLAAPADFEWGKGDVYRLWADEEVVVVPTPTVEPGQVEEVLRRWYRDRFEWKWGHWSNGGEMMPEFQVELNWEKPQAQEG